MSLIEVQDLQFSYEGSYQTIFDKVSFQLDTKWKLGLIGRNGRGKTTLLRLLAGQYEYQGKIISSVNFAYFPYGVTEEKCSTREAARNAVAPFPEWERQMQACLEKSTESAAHRYAALQAKYAEYGGYTIDSLLEREISLLGVKPEVLNRPYNTLSFGERTKIQLAALFLRKDAYLLIDEPTDHLDAEGREVLAGYLSGKQRFILVSHDRDFLDRTVDHILVIGRAGIEVQRGNFSSWQENRQRQDEYEKAENEKLTKQARRLEKAARAAAGWSVKTESGKHASGAKHAPAVLDKGYVGHKSAKMMKRAKNIQNRRESALEKTKGLRKNIEMSGDLSISALPHHARILLEAGDLSINYGGGDLFEPVSFAVAPGERVSLAGRNGAGKSSVLKLIAGEKIPHSGGFRLAGGTQLSLISQDTSFLSGEIKSFCQAEGLDETLLKTILRKLGFTREQFEKAMDDFSSGQKKKVLLAASLCRPAHLFVWDEPLNFIDVLSRVQIEEMIMRQSPTLLFVEHDGAFCRNVATKTVYLRQSGKK